MTASVACQATLSDYAWHMTADEERHARQLTSHLVTSRLPTDDLARFMLVAIGAYQPLLHVVERWSSLPVWRAAYQDSTMRSRSGVPKFQRPAATASFREQLALLTVSAEWQLSSSVM